MPGKLRGAVVTIEDEPEANRVHNKGYPGIPRSGGSLDLGLLEAAFLMDEKEFKVQGATNLVELFHHAGQYIKDFEVQYIVYRILKLRGFFVKIPDHHFDQQIIGQLNAPLRLLPRGSRPSVPASIYVLAVSERSEFSVDRIVEFFNVCSQKGVEGLAGVVDEDGDVTFYSIKVSSPQGDCSIPESVRVAGKLGQNRVLIPMDDTSTPLLKEGFFGQSMGSMVNLSLIEAVYLMEKGLLSIEGHTTDRLIGIARKEQSDVDLRYPVYKQLRDRGVRVKTGFKYGTHFRAYSLDPDRSHADYLVHVYPDASTVDWQEISRGIRVAHGVNKRILFTSPGLVEQNEFLELTWVRP